ncbi:hypothetical protein ACS0TY_013328 [Phlomoides rotata]
MTKEVYEQLTQGREEDRGDSISADVFRAVWKTIAPLKVKMHAWRVVRERISTKSNLVRRNGLADPGNILNVCGVSLKMKQ